MRRVAPFLAAAMLLWTETEARAWDVYDQPVEKGPFGRLKVGVGGFFQPRFKYVFPDADLPTDPETTIYVQRMRLEFKGDLLARGDGKFGFSLHNKFSVELSPTPELKDAYVDFSFGDLIQFRVGQFKVPVHRGNLTSDSATMFPDRDAFAKWGPDRDIGAQFFGFYGKHIVDWEAGVWGGDGSNVTKDVNPGMMYAGRIVFSPLGGPGTKAEVLRDAGENNKKGQQLPTFSLGYSASYAVQGAKDAVTHTLAHNAEAMIAYRFFTVNGEYTLRTIDAVDAAGSDFKQSGFYVSAAVFPMGVPWAQDHLAVLARVEQGDAKITDGDPGEIPAGDGGQAFRKSTIGLGIYANKPMFKTIHDLRAVFAYALKQETEGPKLDNDEISLSMNASF